MRTIDFYSYYGTTHKFRAVVTEQAQGRTIFLDYDGKNIENLFLKFPPCLFFITFFKIQRHEYAFIELRIAAIANNKLHRLGGLSHIGYFEPVCLGVPSILADTPEELVNSVLNHFWNSCFRYARPFILTEDNDLLRNAIFRGVKKTTSEEILQ